MFRRAPKPDGRALLFVFLTVFMSMIGMGIIIPVMPELIMSLTGRSEADSAALNGYLLFVYAVMQFIMSPILGALSDRFGRRPILLLSLLAYALDYLLMALAPTYALLFLGRMLSGGFAATYATANAFIADISPPEKRAANFGLMGAAFGLGFIIGPAIGGWVGSFDPRYPFLLASAVVFANLLFGYLVFPETVTAERRRPFQWRRANPLGGLISVSKHKVVFGVLMAYFLMQFSHHALTAVWAFFAKAKYGWDEAQIGWSISYVGLTAAFMQGLVVRRTIPQIGETRAVIIGIAAMSVSMVGYALFSPNWIALLAWVTLGSAGGFMMPGMQGIMSRATPADSQGELQGAIASLMSLTMAFSPLTMTQIFKHYADREGAPDFPGAPFIVSAIILLVALIPFAWAMRQVPPKAESADKRGMDPAAKPATP
ncbi:TCR/Tet family MFS transporter [Parvularcula sp. LCG005]|uniref:TCR/Tet family MFS transporter n=1 Tax=Parvularcula sp. LCG005 TaxID=3078805 RepID=UPI002941E0E7|nr:TCR/Tet family MFS transporter [Parvularcula sp. LCG005]WOI52491.1 TCR/Tet family MFS transporter [Parvularcula sp. LCG005]